LIKNVGVSVRQTETKIGVVMLGLGRVVVACRISQSEGTEKSASLFVSEVCRALSENDAKVTGEEVNIVNPDAEADFADAQPTCVRKLLDVPGMLLESGVNGTESGKTGNGPTEGAVAPENGVVLKAKGNTPSVRSRSSSFES
jgi:hypothetical protein